MKTTGILKQICFKRYQDLKKKIIRVQKVNFLNPQLGFLLTLKILSSKDI